MKIVCQSCGRKEEVNKDFFLKVLGGVVSGFGFWAWTAFLFAGTGFAMPICIAIMAGGGALMAFSDEITEWVTEHYDCPQCSSNSWIEEEEYKKLQAKEQEKQKALKAKEAEKEKLKKDNENLQEEVDYAFEEVDRLENEKVEFEKLESKQVELENKLSEVMKKLEQNDK